MSESAPKNAAMVPGYAESRAALAQRKARQRHQARLRRQQQAPARAALVPQPEPVSPTQRVGAAAERLARCRLEAAGLGFVAGNVSTRFGEIDLIMRDGDVLVFIEVRQRAGSAFGGAAETVGYRKQQRLRRAAEVFLQRLTPTGRLPFCRFDVVAFDDSRMQWLRAVF